jgi:lipoprotein NlpI
MKNWTSVSCLIALMTWLLVGFPSQSALARQEKQPTEKEQAAAAIAELGPQATTPFEKGQYVEAFQKAAKICQLDPDNIRHRMLLGSASFAAGKMNQCVAAYDEAIRLDPTTEPYLWQRGLALYYADRFDDGVKQFETHQTVNSQDVENAVWHLLCAARVSDVEKARKKLIPITGDTRIPMSQIYEMFAGRMTPAEVLRSAKKTSARVKAGSHRQKLQLYYAHLYTGLYHEMLKDRQAAVASLRKAAEVNPLEKTNFMGQVARVDLMLRGKVKPKE